MTVLIIFCKSKQLRAIIWLIFASKCFLMKNRFVLFVLLLLPFCLSAQDTITVMQYNLLQYGNLNSAYAGCDETTNNTQEKDESIRTILQYVQPDILTVNEFGATQDLLDDFMRHNLNINGVSYWKSDDIINYANSDIVNHIFYNSNKLALKKHAVIRTSVRDIDAYELYFKTASLVANDTISLVCIVAHLKAGNDYEATRRAQLQNVMDYIDENYPQGNVLIMGDFNMYSSAETGYLLVTHDYSNTNVLLVDPVGSAGVGPWNNNGSYAAYHTQSTTSDINADCKASGGLDDRFDFILMADEVCFGYHNVRYVSNSYTAVGNDGNHFNRSINAGTNAAVPETVANALFQNSDHLPVTVKLAVNAKLKVDDSHLTPEYAASIAPNPASDFARVCFFNRIAGNIQFDIYNIQGMLVKSETDYFDRGNQLHRVDVSDLQKGFYVLRISNYEHLSESLKIVIR